MKRLLLGVTVAAALWGAACGGGTNFATPPPPVGRYTLASLKGQYAYVTNGETFNGSLSATPLARTGSFTADGLGNITGGVEDVNAAGITSLALQITGGNYTVNADGRGRLTLDISSNGVTSSIIFGIVLTSTNDGLMIDETSNSAQSSTGSGNFIKQTPGSFAISTVSGAYVFDFSGLDNIQPPNQGPISIVGQFTASNGPITTGVEDVNDNGAFTTAAAVSGNFAADGNHQATLTGNGRGIALINGSQYAFYIVDSSRVRSLSISGGMLSGDAVIQNIVPPATLSSSSFVFIVAGSSAKGGVTRVGRFTANGASLTNIVLDTNNSGTFTKTGGTGSGSTFSNTNITMDQANPGRGTLTFTASNVGVPFTFVFYLSSATSGVIQDISHTSSGVATDVADGSIEAQAAGPFSASNITGTYAFNWSGLSIQTSGNFSIQDEEDVVAQATVSNLSLAGAADSFQFFDGIPVTDSVVSGSITPGGAGTGADGQRNTLSVKLTKSNSLTVSFVVYVVNPQLAFFANDINNQGSTRIVAGILKAQQ